ncbi:collagenase [Sphaerisporangium fuscum]|uniref:collagenase n=1 Tax=Sphaerisporangium fuscum TaxID=2835868 RepID=UPI001BDC8D87|nr:collagenase [Sphaerisporangium fuscum]
MGHLTPRFIAAGMSALAVAACLALTPSIPAVAGAPARSPKPEQVGARDSSPDKGAPRSAYHAPLSVAAARPELVPEKNAKSDRSASPQAPVAQTCTVDDFANRSGSALVAFVKGSATSGCLYGLFNLSQTDGRRAFTDASMTTVSNALGSTSASYPGDNSTQVEQLLLYLRAGYYVQYKYMSSFPAFSAATHEATRAGLDVLVNSARFLDVDDENGSIGHEALYLTENADLQAKFLNAYKRVLDGYNSSTWTSYNMLNFANGVMNPILSAYWNADFTATLTADPSLLDTLYNFAIRHFDLLPGDNYYLPANAGGLMTHAVTIPALKSKVQPLTRDLLSRSALGTSTAPLWIDVAGEIDQNDKANCSYYNACDFLTKMKAASQSRSYSCDSTHRIVAQAMTNSEFTETCTSILNQDAYFHTLVRDNGPIPGDYKGSIELDIFATRRDYHVYSQWIYGNSTDNGGEFLDGDPTDPNNQPRFITFQELNQSDGPWAANIRNLNHEYTHYLDSRYDMKGGFTQETSYPNIWWIEGVAEYVSYGYRGVIDRNMISEAATHRYSLSTLWQSTYDNADTTRTYPWGHLAVRYMFERHRSDIDHLLGRYRAGDYQGAYNYVNSTIGNRYDSDFDSWLTACANGACASTSTQAKFSTSVNGLTVTLTDQSTASAGATITGRSWSFGDGTTSTASNPTKTYSAAGTYTISLTVTDSKGKTASTSQPVTVSGGGGGSLPTCSGATYVMGQNCQRSGISGAQGNSTALTVYVPAGVTLAITTFGGSGNADVYYNPSTWATRDNYTAVSRASGNSERLSISNATAGWRYITLYGSSAFSGLTIQTRF